MAHASGYYFVGTIDEMVVGLVKTTMRPGLHYLETDAIAQYWVFVETRFGCWCVLSAPYGFLPRRASGELHDAGP